MTKANRSSLLQVAPRLTAALDALRARRRLRAALTTLCAALAAGLAVLLVARLAAQFIALPVSAEVMAMAAALVAGLAGFIASVVRMPGLSQVAREADQRLDLGERLSSALEVAGDWDREKNVITDALLRDAEARAGSFEARQLVPLRSRALMGTAAGAILAGAGLLLVPAVANVPAPGASFEEAVAPGAGEQAAPQESEIRRLAEMLTTDAERRNSELLQAIANSLEKLADEQAAGRPTEEIAEELRELIDMAKQAYGARPPAFLPADSGDFAQLEKLLDAEENRMAALPEYGVSYENPYDYYGPRDWNKRGNEEQPEDMPQMGMGNGEGEGQIDPNFDGDATPGMSPEMSFEPKPIEDPVAMTASSAGAAADSNKGESQMAGGGGEALTAEALAEAEFQASSDMSIRAERPETEGKRIRLEMPPETEASDAADASLGDGNRSRSETDAVSRSLVDAQARGVVARYFAPNQG